MDPYQKSNDEDQGGWDELEESGFGCTYCWLRKEGQSRKTLRRWMAYRRFTISRHGYIFRRDFSKSRNV